MADQGTRHPRPPGTGGDGLGDDASPSERLAQLRRLRRRIDALDRRIVALLNQRAELGRAAGQEKAALGRRVVRDVEREREVLLRVAIANGGPIPQEDLLAIYRRLMNSTRRIEGQDRAAARVAARGRG